ncbi:MAG: molecular chaperone Skp [Deltaproteobacteria bacterium]|nr:MAG: molecular chaperone Skp [Deltaproteobacteria bacterium]
MRQTIMMICCMLLFTSSALAASSKIGVVNMQKIIATSEPGQAAMKTLQDKFKDEKVKMDKQKEAIQTLQQELQKQEYVLSQEAKEDKQLAYKRKVRDFQDMYRSLQRKIKIEEQKLSEPVIKLVVDVITTYGKKQGYTTISDAQASGLIYVDPKADLTETILVEVNRAWRASKKGKGTK